LPYNKYSNHEEHPELNILNSFNRAGEEKHKIEGKEKCLKFTSQVQGTRQSALSSAYVAYLPNPTNKPM
jgi:hypothetical protein